MPNRLLKETICTSDNIDQLSAFAEIAFYRLIVNCDDFGRMDARTKILKSRLFPLKAVDDNKVANAMKELEEADLITLYTVGGKPYLQMNTWKDHQQVRNQKSKYPSPDDADGKQMQAIDSNCNQLISNDINREQKISDDIKCPRNPIQSESNPNPNPNPKAAALDASFNRFWSAYPRHEGKQAAQKAFSKVNPSEDLLQIMIAAIEKQKESAQWQEDGGKYIPHPATWLNGRRWEDEPANYSKVKLMPVQDYNQRDYSDAQGDAIKRFMKQAGGGKA